VLLNVSWLATAAIALILGATAHLPEAPPRPGCFPAASRAGGECTANN
jgi:hypothetical protein